MLTKKQQAALDKYNAAAKHLGGCLDGYCVITGKAKGMHTNGGCHCSRDHWKAQVMLRAARELADALNP